MNNEILSNAKHLADEVFRPQAEATDLATVQDGVRSNIRALADAGYFGLGISPDYGGFGADGATRQEYTEMLASACGVTAFTQQQLHSGGGFVGGSSDEELKREYLPQFASGKLLCGVAFSHLRRPGPPMVIATRVDGGYRVNGTAPWVTAWSLMDCFILAAVVESSGNHIYFLARIHEDADGLSAGSPLETVAMRASDTVVVTLDNFFVPDKFALYERPADALRRADFCGITGHVFMPLGCARGSVHYLRTLAAKPGRESLNAIVDAFSQEIDACRHEALTWSGSCADLPEYKERALHTRSASIVLAMRAAHATVTATGGSAHLLTSAPQRLFREAMFYTTMAQTPDVQAGTLDLLISPNCWTQPHDN